MTTPEQKQTQPEIPPVTSVTKQQRITLSEYRKSLDQNRAFHAQQVAAFEGAIHVIDKMLATPDSPA